VACPDTGLDPYFAETVLFSNKQTLTWPTSTMVDAIRGDLNAVRSAGSFVGTVMVWLATKVDTNTVTDAPDPLPGGLWYYLVRHHGRYCNEIGSWISGGTGERPGRDTELP
jgi:hypothetical protein